MGRSVDQTSQCSIVSISLIPTPKPQHPNNKSRSLFSVNKITIFGFHSSQLQNLKNKSRSPQIRKRNITISKSWISLIPAPTPQKQIKKSSKLEKGTAQSPNLGFHSSQLRQRNNKSRNPLSINTLPTNS